MENELVNSTPPAPEEPKQPWSLLQVLKGWQFEVEVVLELVIILLIGFEIVLGIYFHRGDTEASNEQTRLLQEAHSQAQRHAEILKSIADEQNQALRSIIRMSEVLQAQLAILDADQKRRLEQMEVKPRILLIAGGVSLHGQHGQRITFTQLTATMAEFDLSIMNESLLPAESLKLVARADNPNVVPRGDWKIAESIGEKQGRSRKFVLLLPGAVGDYGLLGKLEYPAGTTEFHVAFWMSAANMNERYMGSITVAPPR